MSAPEVPEPLILTRRVFNLPVLSIGCLSTETHDWRLCHSEGTLVILKREQPHNVQMGWTPFNQTLFNSEFCRWKLFSTALIAKGTKEWRFKIQGPNTDALCIQFHDEYFAMVFCKHFHSLFPQSQIMHNLPHKQSKKLSRSIVFQYIHEIEELLEFTVIPWEIAKLVLSYYHYLTQFPLQTNEVVNNPYAIHDRLYYMQPVNDNDEQTNALTKAVVIDKENNWIVIGCRSTRNDYTFGPWLCSLCLFPNSDHNERCEKCPNERLPGEIMEEKTIHVPSCTTVRELDHIEGILQALAWRKWNLIRVTDFGGVFECFAVEIYGSHSYEYVIKIKKQCIEYMQTREDLLVDDTNIWAQVIALCELFNVRVEVYEYHFPFSMGMVRVFNYGNDEMTMHLPLILLFKQDQFFHLISDGSAPSQEIDEDECKVTIRELRLLNMVKQLKDLVANVMQQKDEEIARMKALIVKLEYDGFKVTDFSEDVDELYSVVVNKL